MNVVFKLVILSICLNLATGIIIQAIPSVSVDPTNLGGLSYDEQDTVPFIAGMNESVNPSGLLEDKGDANYRILDMLNVGFYQRFLNTVKQYVYGFVYFLDSTLGSYLDTNVQTVLFGFPFGVFYSMINVGYILAAFKLWTGKDLRD